ncbi:MAG: amidase [Gammaproteobacteria bacterium]|nr:amidase [Gammaproteobacteria bacterium]MDH3414598.1 amidase [Gammaproteobacteria bacterium]
MTEAFELTATEGLRAMEAGELTAEAWVASCLERIRDREQTVLAWEYLDRDRALARARDLDRAGGGGLATGVPFGAKDIIDTADMPTAYGSPIHQGHRPDRDAGCVAITRAAGAVLLGKTVTTEFGHRYPGKTRNPFNPAHTPGGSSSGSAAAVGDKMIPLAYGTQTTGSVIRPAAFCGTVGYKPTYGDFNNNGVMPNSPTIDTLGAMVRSVEDLALVRSVLLEEPLAALKPPAMGDLNIGFYRSPFWDRAEGYTQSHVENAAKRLSGMGARMTDLKLPGIDADFENLFRLISGFEFSRTVSWERFNRLGALSADLREGRMKEGMETAYEDYRKGTRRLERLRLEIDDVLDGYDVLITLSAPGEPPKGLRTTGNAIFNSIWTALGTPAVTLPVFEGPSGLPVGLQLIAGRSKDRRLFDIAKAVMKALG